MHHFLDKRQPHQVGGITSQRHLTRQKRLGHLNNRQTHQQKLSLLAEAQL